MTIDELIAALESAEGPSRELDAAIFNLLDLGRGWIAFKADNCAAPPLNQRNVRMHDGWFKGRNLTDKYAEDLDRFTASIDAAVALIERVLPGWNIVKIEMIDEDAKLYECQLETKSETGLVGAYGVHKSIAIALCIALLRAVKENEG